MAFTEVTLTVELVDHPEFMGVVEAAVGILRADEQRHGMASAIADLRSALNNLVDRANDRRHEGEERDA